jgi:hypothetical protein
MDQSSQSQVDQAVQPCGDPQPLVPHGWLRALLCVIVR